ncbi:amino acid adenylation domain-containing protein [Nocardia sp. CA-128927]|uniref:amino acid adenylation domain-containing protein n=1 Tax=Nocardia sp. CA-128927 TaxID=3239975 RepID=UPI003D968289
MNHALSRADRMAALPEDLREQLRQRLAGRAAPDRNDEIPRESRERPLPLSAAQERLWYMDELEPGSIEFNTTRVLRLLGDLDTAALTRALGQVVQRHETLRTTFTAEDGRGRQVVHPAGAVPVDTDDLLSLPESARRDALERILVAEARRPFDLRRGPLFRVRLLCLHPQEHVLVLNMHHIITDGWSLGLLTGELSELYTAELAGIEATLPELRTQYADFAVWQRTQLAGTALREKQDYWREKLRGLAPLELPTDLPRPPVRTSAGAVQHFEVAPGVVERLRELGRDSGVTLFMSLVTAVQLLLARWTGRQDIAVGTATSGRGRVETENLIGFFVNTVVLRSRIDEAQPFSELLKEVRSTVLDAFAHQDVPFQNVVDAVQPERDLSRPALAEVVVNLHNTPSRFTQLPGLRLEELPPPVVSASADLAVDFFEQDGALTGHLYYNTDLFTAATVARMAGHLTTLLHGIAENPGAVAAELPMLPQAEYRRLTRQWPVRGAGSRPRTAPELFAEQVARDPAATALIWDDVTVDYAELDARANRMARLLRARGAGPETTVAVALPRSVDLVVTMVAVFKSGAAYLPLDPKNPAERLEYIVGDAAPALVVTSAGFDRPLPGEVSTIDLTDPETAVVLAGLSSQALTASELPVQLLPSHPSYVIYTSGSTGRPKGVMVTHTGIHGMVDAQVEQLGAGPGARVLQFAAIGFDAAIWEWAFALLSGGALVIASQDQVMPGEPLIELVDRHGITHVTLPPSALAALPEDSLPASLTVIVAGEAFPPGLARTWSARHRLINAYGPSESTVCATMSQALAPDDIGDVVSIGYPLPGIRVYLLDARLRPVPVGVPGDMYLAGDGLARGYLGRHDLTARRFVADPYGAPGERMYQTGDRARWLPDGALDFVGRTDDQVKLRGFRIELGEVESVLSQYEGVSAAAVAVKQDDRGTRRLVAYAVPARAGGDQSDSATESAEVVAGLRQFTRARLPEHMVPGLFVVMDALPLNANGKVDRHALPDPEPDLRHGLGASQVAPRNQVEKELARIWSELLGVDRVGVEDNFFELGGDSILSLQVVARARDAGLHLTAKQTFLRQTIAELAAEAGTVAEPARVVDADQDVVTGDLPLTPIHHWFFDNLTESLDRFNQSMLLELTEDAEVETLRRAIRALVEQHDALRLRATTPGAGQWQLHNAAVEHSEILTVTDLSAGTHEQQQSAMRSAMAQAQTGFDLAAGPLLRACLFQLGATERPRLFVAVHHLAVDGVSWRILLADLARAYRQAGDQGEVELGPKTTSFREWATRLDRFVAADGLAGELDYWKAVEAKAGTVSRLPVDAHGANTVQTVRSTSSSLSPESTEALLREVPHTYRTQINDVLLSALGQVLSEWSGGDRVLLALEGHGRADLFDDVDTSRTVGWFTTLFPVVLTIDTAAGWGSVLKSAKEQLRAIPNHGLGYGALRYLGGAAGDLGRGPVPEVGFNYLGQFDTSAETSDLRIRVLPSEGVERSPHQHRQQLIELNGWVRDGRLEFSWSYSVALHRPETIERLAAAFVCALEQIIEHCAEPGAGGVTPSDFPLAALDQATLDRIAGNGRAIEDIYPLTATQSGMLFHALQESGRDMYTGYFGMRVDGVTDPDALVSAWQRVVDRTPALRTSVVWEDVPAPLQVVHAHAQVPITHLDYRALPADEQRQALDRLWQQREGEALDLATAPLLRLTIVRLSDSTVQMFWSSHHMLVDGWSFGAVQSDVFEEFGRLTGRPVGTPAMRRPYRDYVAWLAGQDGAQAQQYWRQVVADFTAPTPLPYDRPKLGTHAVRSSRELRRTLSTARSRRLYEHAKNMRLTVNTLVQGAWALLLSRYSGEQQVLFGATVSGRPATLAGAESMIGLFINTVPVRAAVDGERPITEWLHDIQLSQLDAKQYEHVSLTEIQRIGGVPGGGTLFDSIVVFENYPFDSAAAAAYGLRVHDVLGDEHTNYSLTLTAHAGTDLLLALGYDPNLFDAETIERMAGHLDTILQAFVEQPDAPVAETPILPAAERRQLLVEWNDTAVHRAPARLVHEVFADQAVRTPTAVAVRDGRGELSFAELDSRSNQVAHHLLGLGVGTETLVGVCLDRGVDAVVTLLAVLKAGAAFVPLDPDYPPQRLGVMLHDSAAPVIVTEDRLRDRITGHDAAIVLLDGDGDELAAQPTTAPVTAVTPDDLAYVVFTSGTTGRPKGVMVEHRHVHHMVRAWDERYGLTELRPRALSVSSLSVDLFFGDFLLSALFGGTMTVCPTEAVTDPVALADLLLSTEAELMVTVPTLAKALVDEFAYRGTRPDSLRVLMVGSEGWPAEDAKAVAAALAARTVVVNAYGATETTVDSAVFQLGIDPIGQAAFVPVGRPLADTRIYVLDREMRPVPVGVVGECYIAGDGVARGYLNRPQLTAERFLDDPFSGHDGARMYRTGDLARWRADGNLECLGRADDQVKVRGFRVELGEVEAALARHAQVAAAAAAVGRDDAGRGRLIGYVVPVGGAVALDKAALQAFLSDQLPAAAVPTGFVVLDALPKTPSGTVDRRALPTPALDIDPGTPYVAPHTATERALAVIWAEVLGVQQVGVDDNFFTLGGDSLLSIRVISRIRTALGVAPSPRQLFDTPTLAGLSAAIDNGLGRAAEQLQLSAVDRQGPLPLSFAQQRLWFLNDFHAEDTAYNTVYALRLSGELDTEALHQALDQIVARHEPLRTTYDAVDGRGVQVIHAPTPTALPRTDLSAIPDSERTAAVREAVSRMTAVPFDLRRGPVIRMRLLRLGEHEHVLALVIHHIATDGWSWTVLAEELGTCYASASRGERAQLPPLTVQYADYAAWQRKWLADSSRRADFDYWRDQLADLPPLALPTDRPRAAVRSRAGALHSFELSADILAGLETVARAQDATLFMALTAAVQVLLARYCGQDDITVGTPTSGRNRRELEPLIGCFLNTAALRSRVDESLSFGEFLARVRSTVLEAFVHDEMPFDQLVERLRPERDPSRTPLVEVMVNLGDDRSSSPRLPGIEATELTFVSDEVGHDLSFTFAKQQGTLAVVIGYSTALFDIGTIQRMGEHLRTTLSGVLTEHRRLAELPLLNDSDRRMVVEQWNSTACPPPHTTVVDRIAEQAAATPELSALIGPDEPGGLTFSELNARANRLARHLISGGVGPEDVVAVKGSRTTETVVSILAVLKAGAAYLPVDPDLPAERLGFMLREAAPKLVLVGSGDPDGLPGVPAEVPCVRWDDPEVVAALPGLRSSDVTDADRRSPLRDQNAAYVIFTSGSTGRPKGVVVEHRSMANLFTDRESLSRNESGARNRMRVGLTATMAFDTSVEELTLLIGGDELHIIDDLTRRDPEALVAYVDEHRIDHLHVTPTLARELTVAQLLTGPAHRLERLVLGGEPVDDRLWQQVAAAPDTIGYNSYGPTECTVYTHRARIDAAAGPHIGRPRANTRAYVLDRYLRPVPLGAPGELHVAGVQLARGYRNRPGLTAERFVADPFGAPGERLYRTGDVVRQLADGTLETLGRTDDQVKVRGYRIELGEIEQVLANHPHVTQAAAVVRTGATEARQIVAYVTAAEALDSLVDELRHRASSVLPNYMVPAAFVVLDELPLTSSGKIDRKALPAPEPNAVATVGYVAPRTEVETILTSVWAQVLDVERVGIEDNFFGLGGDSILSIQAVHRIRQAGLAVTSKNLFLNQTVRQLATVVTAVESKSGTDRAAVVGPVHLTPIQREFFAAEPAQPHHFTQSVLLELAEGVDEAALRAALAVMREWHDALRMRYEHRDGGWRQHCEPIETGVDLLRRHDLSALPEPERTATVQSLAVRADAGLDLASARLLQGLLFDFGPEQRPWLFLTIHHLVVDAVSWRILLDDLAVAYQQVVDGKRIDLEAKTTSFQEWSERLGRTVAAGGFDEQLPYWTALPQGGPLPTDGDGPNVVGSTRTVSASLAEQDSEVLLRKSAGVFRTRVNEVLIAGLARTLAQWTGEQQVLIDLEGHGREDIFDEVDLSRTVGWFTTRFPVCLDTAAADDWPALVKSVRRQLRAVPDKGLGYGALRYLSAPTAPGAALADRTDAPVVFNYHGNVDGMASADDHGLYRGALPSVGQGRSPDARSSHLLEVVGLISDGKLQFTWHYSKNVFERATIERVAQDFLDTLSALAAHVGRR